ncbi:GIP, partial [Symbiodinium necroappetens]
DTNRSVNAYMTDYFIGGLEVSDTMELNSASANPEADTSRVGMLDCGATASAAPEAVVQGLISAVLSKDKTARIELDQSARPYFRFGNGRWGRAVCRTHIHSNVSGNPLQFSLYTLPNPAEYYESHYASTSLVPVLIGMDFLGKAGVGMMIDFATGLAMMTKEPQPRIFQLEANRKGHYTLDIVQYLTKGQTCHEGQAHVITAPTIDPEAEEILAAALKAKTAKAKPKSRPRSFDPARRVKADPRDPRTKATQWPCYNKQTPGTPQSNAWGQWVKCQCCNLRMLYTPRKGAPANSTESLNHPTVKKMLDDLHEEFLQMMDENTAPSVLDEFQDDHLLSETDLEVFSLMSNSSEAMAREARAAKDYSYQTMENVLMEVHRNLQPLASNNRRWGNSDTTRLLLGGYSHGAFAGLTKNTQRHQELTHYINDYLAHHAPHHAWTSLMISFNCGTTVHQDHHNLTGSQNVLHCLGNFEHGGLWLQGTPPDGFEVTRRRLMDGNYSNGYVVNARYRFVTFDPKIPHATQAWRGFRIAISSYTTRLLPQMTREDRAQLRRHGFRLTSSTTTFSMNQAVMMPVEASPLGGQDDDQSVSNE